MSRSVLNTVIQPCCSNLPASKFKDIENEYSRIWDDAMKLVEDITKADDYLGCTLGRTFDDLNYNRYKVYEEAERGLEVIQEYEDIMECTFTVVKVPDNRAMGLNSWCIDNLKSDWHRLEDNRMAFVDADEAMMFKLVWGGKS